LFLWLHLSLIDLHGKTILASLFWLASLVAEKALSPLPSNELDGM
jgi:hypothetical protein